MLLILESQTGFFIILGIKQILKINLSYCIFPQFIHTESIKFIAHLEEVIKVNSNFSLTLKANN